jgi:hypothetical protein
MSGISASGTVQFGPYNAVLLNFFLLPAFQDTLHMTFVTPLLALFMILVVISLWSRRY